MKDTKSLEAGPEADSDVTPVPESRPGAENSEAASPDEAEIRELAYQYWEESERPPGSADEHWFRAERNLRERSNSVK